MDAGNLDFYEETIFILCYVCVVLKHRELFPIAIILFVPCVQLLGNKWQVSQDKINHFRTALLNPLTSRLFRHFIGVKGDFYENNVLFWLEIEKYKVLQTP
jgi:hypothetical protein